MKGFLFVGLGGALGAVLRYAISLFPYKGTFPVLTFITNVLGALLIGYIAGAAARRGLSQNLVLFLKTGVCGGFTTFSTVSLEAYNLFDGGHYITEFIIYKRIHQSAAGDDNSIPGKTGCRGMHFLTDVFHMQHRLRLTNSASVS